MSNHSEDQNWDRVAELLREADCVPESPDCRSAVMGRIGAPARKWSYAWALACAAIVIAIAGTWVMLPRAGRQLPVVKIARKAPAPLRVVARHVEPPAPVKPQTVVSKHVATARQPRQVHVVYAPPKPVVQPKEVPVAPQPTVPVVQPPTPVSIANQPVAIAIVTYPSGREQASDTYSYGYTSRDTRTGETTECRVKRSGNSVEVYMETKPETKEPPVKGSVRYEPKPSA
jgi:hypothetical protein